MYNDLMSRLARDLFKLLILLGISPEFDVPNREVNILAKDFAMLCHSNPQNYWLEKNFIPQSARAVEYTECISAEG